MKSLLWLAAIAIAFVSGYFFHGSSEKNILPKEESLAVQHNIESKTLPKCAPAAEVVAQDQSQPVLARQPIKAASETPIASAETAKAPKDAAPAEAVSSASGTGPVSDEIIDKTLPAPFNEIIKKSNGSDKETYKKFAETSVPQDWDIKMQNKLTDAIFSSPHVNALTIDSIICKGNICEVRVFEHKNGFWAVVMADMRLQSWWEFGPSSNYGFGMMKDDKLVTGNIALFVRQ